MTYYDANFSNTTGIPVGGWFNETDQQDNIIRRWNVTSISSDGTVNLEGINTLNNGYIIDTSISKSGTFIVGDFWDSEWLKVDLDGDGQYQRDWMNPNDFNSTYRIVLADNATPGIYDTVFVSNVTSRGTNFTKNGINASNGDPVAFGGKPVYLVSLKKEGENYNVAFTSYTTGFGGMWLGTFEKGKNLTVPFLVQYPGTTAGISDANVIVDRLTWYGPNPDVTLNPAASATTDAYGLARVTINTTNIPTGQYLISYKVTLPDGKEKTATEKWRMPGLEIRKFIIEADIGNIGTISTHLITNDNGLTVAYGTEIEPKGVASAYRITGPDSTAVFRVGWPFDMENDYYYNASDGRYYTGFDWDLQNTTGSPVNNNSINLTRNGANTTYNFTQFIRDGSDSNISIPIGQTMGGVYNYWNITAASPTRLEIDYLLGDMPPQPWDVGVDSQIFWGPGELNIRITANDAGAVNFTLMQPKIVYQVENLNVLMDGDTSNGEWASGRVTKVSYKGYDVYGYDDRNQTEVEKQPSGWSPTLDHVLVANSAWNRTYPIGERIPELDNEYAGLAARWGGKILFINDSIGIYPFQDWAPDGDSYYVGTFNESDVNVDLNNNFDATDNTTYYIRLEDNNPNGVFNVTSGMFDDDRDFTQSWGESGSSDLYSSEQGSTDMMGWKFDERWITLGSMYGWPFGVPEVNYNGNFANLTTFSPRWEPFGLDDEVTTYVSARSFSNQPVNGNISLDKLIVLFKSNQSDEGMMMGGTSTEVKPGDGGGGFGGAPQVYDIPGMISPITDGIGIWSINYSVLSPVVGSFDSGNFVARLNITDSDGNFETVERSFFMQNQTAFGCKDPALCGGGGGDGGGGFK